MARCALPLTLACLASAWAQTPLQVEIDLAATAYGSPRAWRHARELLAGTAQLDARAPLRVVWRDERLHVLPGERSTQGAYLRATVILGNGIIHVACDQDGHEAWSVDQAAAESAAYRALLDWLDLGGATAARAWFDTPALVGLLGPGFETESPHGVRRALVATECGDLVVARERRDRGERLRARSGGGLLLPAALLWLSQRTATSTDQEQRWLRLAFAARDARRDEAMLQLARFTSADSERGLRALCRDHSTAPRAIESLTRRRAIDSLGQLATLASTQPDAVGEVATAAIATLWPRASAEVRADVRARADRRLHGVLADLDAAKAATMLPRAAPSTDDPTTPPTRRGLAASLLFTAGLLAILLARRSKPTLPPQ